MLVALFLVFLLLISCSDVQTVAFGWTAALSSDYPQDVINGKDLHDYLGLGGVRTIKSEVYTYPIAYLGSNYSIDSKDSIALGGLDISQIKSDFTHASLKLFVNYKDCTRKNILIFVRPIIKPCTSDVCFNDFYKYDKINNEFILTDKLSNSESRYTLVSVNVKSNENNNETTIPFNTAKRTISIDVTEIMKYWINHPNEYYGLLLDPMWQIDMRYCTTDEDNQVCDTGVMEIATTAWYTWNETSTLKGVKYMKNNGFGKIKYIPRLEIRY